MDAYYIKFMQDIEAQITLEEGYELIATMNNRDIMLTRENVMALALEQAQGTEVIFKAIYRPRPIVKDIEPAFDPPPRSSRTGSHQEEFAGTRHQ